MPLGEVETRKVLVLLRLGSIPRGASIFNERIDMKPYLEETLGCGDCDNCGKTTFRMRLKSLKHWRDPCKKCLVQPCCSSICEKYVNYDEYLDIVIFPIKNFFERIIK